MGLEDWDAAIVLVFCGLCWLRCLILITFVGVEVASNEVAAFIVMYVFVHFRYQYFIVRQNTTVIQAGVRIQSLSFQIKATRHDLSTNLGFHNLMLLI